MAKYKISVITLSFDNQEFTEKFVQSIRRNTTLDYELIIVDNGSHTDTQQWVKKVSDNSIIFNSNRGFAKGFNAGLSIAKGEYILMANNDTEFPKDWDILLLENFSNYRNLGLVSPVYTSGAEEIALRKVAGKNKKILNKFGKYPSGVAFFSKKEFIDSVIGGWSEDYYIASGEDADYCYKVWSKNYDILIDERVLVKHEGKVTTKTKIPKWNKLWKKNARQFRRRWFFYRIFKPLSRIYVKYKYSER